MYTKANWSRAQALTPAASRVEVGNLVLVLVLSLLILRTITGS
jgi:hypothetical protein